MWSAITTIIGLTVFEVISSIDNAIVNAHVLKTVPERYRKFFLVWGMLFAVFLVRGLLPFIIIWMANPSQSFMELWQTVWGGSGAVEAALKTSKPLLLVGGGTYLALVFLGWLFLEEKRYAFLVEHFLHRQSAWFYAISSVGISLLVWASLRTDPMMALSVSIGSTAFFIGDGFKANAQQKEKELEKTTSMSAWSKILYLEVLDMSFSIDGVIGAFAFTLSVPLILLGSGLGAIIVRQFTVRGMGIVTRYAYLKNGAMYSIGFLGALMLVESFGHEYPSWIAPLNTLLLLVIFVMLSKREMSLAAKRS